MKKSILILTTVFLYFLGFSLYLDEAYQKQIPPKVTIFAAGDLMLDRTVRQKITQEGVEYPFKHVKELISSYDISVANLEGSFTRNQSIAVKDHSVLRFTFDPLFLPELEETGFDVVSMANNHAWDFGSAGYEENLTYLTERGIKAFGSPFNTKNLSAVTEVKGIKIAFVGYHEFYSPRLQPVLDEIKRLRVENDFIIVYPHWGVEYLARFTPDQQIRAHAFIDAGADVVIGAHPHVIEPIEIYRNKAIFYSLGNFLFDQDFSLPTKQGLSLGIELTEGSVKYSLMPLFMKQSQIYIPSEIEAYTILQNLSQTAEADDILKGDILKGTFTLTL